MIVVSNTVPSPYLEFGAYGALMENTTIANRPTEREVANPISADYLTSFGEPLDEIREAMNEDGAIDPTAKETGNQPIEFVEDPETNLPDGPNLPGQAPTDNPDVFPTDPVPGDPNRPAPNRPNEPSPQNPNELPIDPDRNAPTEPDVPDPVDPPAPDPGDPIPDGPIDPF